MALPLFLAAKAAASANNRMKAEQARSIVSGMNINMTSNADAVQKAIQGFSKQFPFAMANTLNDAAFAVRKQIVEDTYPDAFTVRNSALPKAMFRVEKANKKKLKSAVFDRLNKDYMEKHASGGIKTPRGKSIAIPGRDMKMRAKGGVTKANRPRQLLNRKNVFKTTLKRSGQQAIVRRATKQRYPLQMLYILEPSGRIKKKFDFFEDANTTARRAIEKSFKKRFEQAKRTAKRR